ncbi:MAG: class I SAM-dependent methyltransferase [Planctomycetaceae bacterium]
MSKFYDQIASLYHLIFPNWEESIERQATQLSSIVHDRWPDAKTILDVSCGIGTQSIGLAKRGFKVTASDLSGGAVARAKAETQGRGLEIALSVCDMRGVHNHHQQQFDVVVSADNSITHLLSDDDLLLALQQLHACTRPGGGCLLTVRDYDQEERGTGLVKPYGVREEDGKRYLIFQVWDFAGQTYDMAMYFVVEEEASEPETYVMRTRYNAVGTDHLLALMREAGFTSVERIDGRFYQPVLVGNRELGECLE